MKAPGRSRLLLASTAALLAAIGLACSSGESDGEPAPPTTVEPVDERASQARRGLGSMGKTSLSEAFYPAPLSEK